MSAGDGVEAHPPGLVIIGARGRMGRRLTALAPELVLAVAAEVDRDGPALDAELAAKTRCVIDFSAPEQLPATLHFCTTFRLPLVLGTTGIGEDGDKAIAEAARYVPIVAAPNFSIGVHVLMTLVAEAAQLLDARWDVEIVETHHRLKVDAPSGTALALADRVTAARAVASNRLRHGREGRVGERARGEIGMHAVRGGSIVGEHAVHLFGISEALTLEHRAYDRDIFARGALQAASWLVARPRTPLRYGLGDILGPG